MKQSTHSSREVERDISTDNVEFASAGPWELLMLVLLTLVYSYLYLAVPKLSAQVYGDAATQSYRPVIPILVVGFISAIRPAARKSSRPVVCLALTSVWYAAFLKYSAYFFATDIDVFDTLIFQLGHASEELSAKGYPLQKLPMEQAYKYVPIFGSSIVDMIFFGPLTIVFVGLLRQRARKTQLPSVIPMSSLFVLALVSNSLFQRYDMIRASMIYVLIPLLLALSLASCRSIKALFWILACSALVVNILQSTSTLSCATIPQLLHCRQSIGGLQVLASGESLTGRISVLENEKYRLLKADHSLLGGEWLGQGTGQSIFAAFYLQALAIYAIPQPAKTLSILQIGLGIGTATKTILDSSLSRAMKDGLTVDVVELDPVVIRYAHTYFNIPHPDIEPRLRIHAMDALHFIENVPDMSYDFIAHDIFSGGNLVYSLFTKQFFTLIKEKLRPAGILTVNFVYAPSVSELNFAAVVNTLRDVFMHVESYIETGKVAQINNIVFICSDLPIKLDIPKTNQKPQNTLEQTARSMKEWRFAPDIAQNASLILQDEVVDNGATREAVRDGELQMALTHWRLMRTLLPSPENAIWTTV